MFISLFLPLPKGADPLETVNGLWFRSVCAPPSYLIKYLRSLIGPSRSRPGGGGAHHRSPCMASRRRASTCKRQKKNKKRGMKADVRLLRRLPGGGVGPLLPHPPAAHLGKGLRQEWTLSAISSRRGQTCRNMGPAGLKRCLRAIRPCCAAMGGVYPPWGGLSAVSELCCSSGGD